MKKTTVLCLILLTAQPLFSAHCTDKACQVEHQKPKITQEELLKIAGAIASVGTLCSLAVWYYLYGGKNNSTHNHQPETILLRLANRNETRVQLPTPNSRVGFDAQDQAYFLVPFNIQGQQPIPVVTVQDDLAHQFAQEQMRRSQLLPAPQPEAANTTDAPQF